MDFQGSCTFLIFESLQKSESGRYVHVYVYVYVYVVCMCVCMCMCVYVYVYVYVCVSVLPLHVSPCTSVSHCIARIPLHVCLPTACLPLHVSRLSRCMSVSHCMSSTETDRFSTSCRRILKEYFEKRIGGPLKEGEMSCWRSLDNQC